MSARYVLEGVWSGYTSNQQKVVHRVVVRDAEPFKKLTRILYTDGTALYLSVRLAAPGEKVQEIHSYDDLIRDCLRHGVSSVDALPGDAP